MARKVVFVIVEGMSDDTALGAALDKVFDRNKVHVHIVREDITTKDGVTPRNIIANIGNIVKSYASSQHYKASDFKQIIHIVDTDGTYILNERIIEDLSLEEVIYESNGIHTSNVSGIISRNETKRNNLYRLRTSNVIWKIPYSVYYMSCNLDLVLHNKRNSSDSEKENDAYAFAQRYRDDRDGFIEYICNSPFSVTGDFNSSWELIEKDMNSILRYTNLGIAINNELDEQEEFFSFHAIITLCKNTQKNSHGSF